MAFKKRKSCEFCNREINVTDENTPKVCGCEHRSLNGWLVLGTMQNFEELVKLGYVPYDDNVRSGGHDSGFYIVDSGNIGSFSDFKPEYRLLKYEDGNFTEDYTFKKDGV